MSPLGLFRSRRTSAPPERRAAPEPVLHRSPALAELWRELRVRARSRVLDLGAVSSVNFEQLKPLASRIHIADLPASLAARPLRNPAAFREVLDQALPAAAQEWDVVLAWDLFNYLSREEIGTLAARLAELCAPRALLLALVSFESQITATPLELSIADPEHLRYRAVEVAQRPSPRYSSRDVEQLCARFAIERSFLMQHGLVEYVLRRTEELDGQRPPGSSSVGADLGTKRAPNGLGAGGATVATE